MRWRKAWISGAVALTFLALVLGGWVYWFGDGTPAEKVLFAPPQALGDLGPAGRVQRLWVFDQAFLQGRPIKAETYERFYAFARECHSLRRKDLAARFDSPMRLELRLAPMGACSGKYGPQVEVVELVPKEGLFRVRKGKRWLYFRHPQLMEVLQS